MGEILWKSLSKKSRVLFNRMLSEQSDIRETYSKAALYTYDNNNISFTSFSSLN